MKHLKQRAFYTLALFSGFVLGSIHASAKSGDWSPDQGPATSAQQEMEWLTQRALPASDYQRISEYVKQARLGSDQEIARVLLIRASEDLHARKYAEKEAWPSFDRTLAEQTAILGDLRSRGVDLASEAEIAGKKFLSENQGPGYGWTREKDARAEFFGRLKAVIEQVARKEAEPPKKPSAQARSKPSTEGALTCAWQSLLPMPEQIVRQASEALKRAGPKVGENTLVHANRSNPSCQVSLEVDTRRDPMGVEIEDVRVSVNGRYSKEASTVYGRGLGVIPRSQAGSAR